MLGGIDLFNNPIQQPVLGRRLHDDFLSEIGPPAFLTLPLGDERAYTWGTADATGALNGGITTAPGGFGTLGAAWGLNGTTGYVNVPNSAALNPTAAITLAAIVNPTSVVVNANIVSKGFTSVAVPYIQYSLKLSSVANGSVDFQLSIGGANKSITSPAGIVAAGAWCFLVATYDGANMRLYANGSQVTIGAQTGAIDTYATPVQVGRWGTQASQYFSGLITAPMISGVALTAAQVSSLYNCLLTGDPFPLFAPSPLERAFSLSPAGSVFPSYLLRRRKPRRPEVARFAIRSIPIPEPGPATTEIVPVVRERVVRVDRPARSRFVPIPAPAAAAAAPIIVRRPPAVIRRQIVRPYRPVVVQTKTQLVVSRPTLVR